MGSLTLTGLEGHICPSLVKGLEGYNNDRVSDQVANRHSFMMA